MMTRFLGLLAAALLAGCSTVTPPAAAPAQNTPPPAAFSSLQWLYGSGEGAASSIQAYSAFRAYALQRARSRPTHSAILAEGTTLAAPTYRPCGRRQPLAVVLDIDETVLQNAGYQYDRDVRGLGFTPDSWAQWEQVTANIEPMPGALEAIRALRRANVTVVYNSNRSAAYATQTELALRNAGFDDVEYGRTLWLQQPGASSGKDTRRAEIASRYCVIALAGDQLGDFSDLFRIQVNARRAAVQSDAISALWGNGWFVLSNPVYGAGLTGTRDEVFPPAARWTAPEPAPANGG